MKTLSGVRTALTALLVAYVVADFLLTPLGGLETRPASDVTATGFATLGLLLVGLVLAIVSPVLLFFRPGRSPTTATIAAVLYFPAFLVDKTGNFSSLRAPAAISWLEFIQLLIAGATIVLALRARRERPASGPTG